MEEAALPEAVRVARDAFAKARLEYNQAFVFHFHGLISEGEKEAYAKEYAEASQVLEAAMNAAWPKR